MFEEILSKIAAHLEKYHIPYMIIGGQAVLLYGEPRLTRDIDITVGLSSEGLGKLLHILEGSSFRIIPSDPAAFVKQTMVLPVKEASTGIRVDFIFSYTPYEQQAFQRVTKKKMMDQDVCFASIEDLIIHKIFAGRPRDLEDVKSILIKNPKYDISYIRKWLKEFDQMSSDKKFSETFEEILNSKR